MKKIDISIAKILNFPASMLDYKKGLTDHQIGKAEEHLGFNLPSDLKYFYSKMNGFSLIGEDVFPIILKDIENCNLEGLNQINYREHFEVVNPMPKHYLPFSPNGRGDHYCIDLRTRNEQGVCDVIFWQWDYSFHYPDDIEVVSNSFADWLFELVEELEEELEEEL